MAQGRCELMWLRRLMVKLKINDKEPMKLYCDNKTFISIVHNPMPHDKTKHMEIN